MSISKGSIVIMYFTFAMYFSYATSKEATLVMGLPSSFYLHIYIKFHVTGPFY